MKKIGVETESVIEATARTQTKRAELQSQAQKIENELGSPIPVGSRDWRKIVGEEIGLDEQLVFRKTSFYQGERVRPLVRRRTLVVFDHRFVLPNILAKHDRSPHTTLRRPGQH